MIRLAFATLAAAGLLASVASAQMAPSAPSPEGTVQDQVNETAKLPPETQTTVTVTRRTVTVPAEAGAPMDSEALPMEPAAAPAAVIQGTDVAAREPAQIVVVANSPVPDTAENRAKYGGPESNGGKRTRAKGN